MIRNKNEGDLKRMDEIVNFLYQGGVIPNLGRKPALKEALEMAYELGFERGFKLGFKTALEEGEKEGI